MQKDTKIATGFGFGIVGLLVLSVIFAGRGDRNDTAEVGVENGVQIVEIAAKGGFNPSQIEAQAGLATEIRFTTNGTYDCSSTVVIPSLGYEATLAPTGTEKLLLSAVQATGTLKGTCGMGMYNFEIDFQG